MSNLKLAIYEKWHRGDLRYLLHSGQKIIDTKLNESKNQLFVCNVSRQFGKSFYAVTKIIEHCLRNKKSRIKYATAYQSDLVEFILPTFDVVLTDCPNSLKPKYKVQGSKWVFNNGSEIKLVGLDKSPNSLRGNTIDMIVIDEAGFVDNLHYVYTSIIVPATLHRPNCKILFISTPPSTPAHPFVDFCQKAETEGAYVKLDIYQNPRISQSDIDRMAKELGGYESTSFRRECMCEFITDSDLSIIPEWKDEFVQDIQRDDYFQYYHRYVGLDLGVKDKTAAIYGYYDFRRASLIVEDEFEMSGPQMNTEILANTIKTKEKELWGDFDVFRRISDNNWPIMMLDFSHLHNLTFIATDKDNLEAMINEVRIMVQNGQIIVKPKCQKLIGCLKYGVWDLKKKQFARSNAYGHFDHLAALVYLVRNLAKHANPIPATHGFDSYKDWTYHVEKKHSNNAEVFKNVFTPKLRK
jgi:hypothetical protein